MSVIKHFSAILTQLLWLTECFSAFKVFEVASHTTTSTKEQHIITITSNTITSDTYIVQSNIVDEDKNGLYDINGSVYFIDEPDLNHEISAAFSFNRKSGSTIVCNTNPIVSGDGALDYYSRFGNNNIIHGRCVNNTIQIIEIYTMRSIK